MKIGLYSPFWGSTFGGGEKYLAATAVAVRDAWPEHSIAIVSPAPADREAYERFLGYSLDGIELRSTNPGAGGGGGLLRAIARRPELHRLRNYTVSAQAVPVSAGYDLWISMVYVLPAFSRARRGVILCQFPYRRPGGRSPRDAAVRRVRRRLFGGEVDDFQGVIAQSEYTRLWVERLWERDAVVVNPPVDVPVAGPDWDAKDGVVLSVGRFFAGGHSKRHDLLATVFRRLVDAGRTGWELHLAGSVHHNPRDRAYFAEVQRLAQGYPIHVHPDIPGPELEALYRRAGIYWHAAGYGVDVTARPANLEHFGMTTVEAMGRGAVPVAIALGGQPEVVRDGVDGYLWSEPDQLAARTAELMDDEGRRAELARAARARSLEFTAARFGERMVAALRPHVEAGASS